MKSRKSQSTDSPQAAADYYRDLYEASQRSLMDMASNHTMMLNRVRKIRTSVIMILKNAMPVLLAELERNSGQRLEDMDDELFLSCVQHLVEKAAAPHSRTSPRTAQRAAPAPQPAQPARTTGDGLGRLLADLNAAAKEMTEKPPPDPAHKTSAGPTPEPVPPPSEPDIKQQTEPDEPQAPTGSLENLANLMGELSGTAPEDDEQFPPLDAAPTEEESNSTSPEEPKNTERPEPDEPQAKPPDSRRGPPKTQPQMSPMAATQPSARPQRSRPGPGRRRKPKTEAVPPHEEGLDSLCTKEQSDLLTSLVAVPHPVFTSSLQSHVGGSKEILESWRLQHRKDNGELVRFIQPKRKWESRGLLALPTAKLLDDRGIPEDSWWRECLERCSGARLYELAVMVDEMGPSMSNWSMSKTGSTATMTATTERGSIGVLAVMPHRTASWEGEIVKSMRRFSKEHAIIAVLCTSAERSDEVAAETARSVAESSWSPHCPVVAGLTSDWVNGLASTREIISPAWASQS